MTENLSPGLSAFLDEAAQSVSLHQQKGRPPDYEALSPFFLYANTDVVKRTFSATTQFARSVWGGNHMKHAHKSPFPACDIHRRNEPVATDTVYSDAPAIDGGFKAAQIFVVRNTLVTDAYSMKTDNQICQHPRRQHQD